MKDERLNGKTPRWFVDWHNNHFKSVRDRTKRNERWVYIIIVAIIGSGILASGNVEALAHLAEALLRN